MDFSGLTKCPHPEAAGLRWPSDRPVGDNTLKRWDSVLQDVVCHFVYINFFYTSLWRLTLHFSPNLTF